MKGAGAMLLALVVGCTAAPLAGKPCPCDTAAGYTCCDATMTCVSDSALCMRARCTPIPSNDQTITRDGGPHAQSDGGVDAVQYGASPEQWVSYTYAGDPDHDWATLTLTPQGNGFHVVAHATTMYAGVGLSFLSDNQCIDGTDQRGVQFDFLGDTGAHLLKFSVMADDDVSTQFDTRGMCTGGSMMCYGPTKNVTPSMGLNMVAFDDLRSGMPVDRLTQQRIIKVQWEIEATTMPPDADFTISNVAFY
jgi:hypothetical protein